MAVIKPTPLVKPIYSILYHEKNYYYKAVQRIESQFGTIETASDELSFTGTDYYEREIGGDLKRRFLAMKDLVSPEQLIHFKQLSNLWEEEYSENGNRRVNIDPGYIGPAKLVLASMKNYSHRIYLGRGVYAEITMTYADGDFHKLPWTYPDYYESRDIFLKIYAGYRTYLAQHYADGEKA